MYKAGSTHTRIWCYGVFYRTLHISLHSRTHMYTCNAYTWYVHARISISIWFAKRTCSGPEMLLFWCSLWTASSDRLGAGAGAGSVCTYCLCASVWSILEACLQTRRWSMGALSRGFYIQAIFFWNLFSFLDILLVSRVYGRNLCRKLRVLI